MVKNINMAYYRKEGWKRFTSSIDDRESMHETWEERHLSYLETKRKLSMGRFYYALFCC